MYNQDIETIKERLKLMTASPNITTKDVDLIRQTLHAINVLEEEIKSLKVDVGCYKHAYVAFADITKIMARELEKSKHS